MFSMFKRSISQVSILQVHNPSSPPSRAALSLLESALASPFPPKVSKAPLKFNLEVVESVPTPDQLQTIMSYSTKNTTSPSSLFLSSHPSSVGATPNCSSISKLGQENPSSMKWPIVVDWDRGQVAIGCVDDVRSILETLRKVRDGETKENEGDQPTGWFS